VKAPFVIPREINIRGRRWLVMREQELPADVRHTKSEMRRGVTLGQAHREKREIYLAHHDNPRMECETFLHELMHACVRFPKGPLEDAQEERFILHVEASLLRALEQLEWLP
jgi:hypothetical protein